MKEYSFKIDCIKEEDYTEEQLEYIARLRVAAEPIRIWVEGLVKDCK